MLWDLQKGLWLAQHSFIYVQYKATGPNIKHDVTGNTVSEMICSYNKVNLSVRLQVHTKMCSLKF